MKADQIEEALNIAYANYLKSRHGDRWIEKLQASIDAANDPREKEVLAAVMKYAD